MPTYTPIVTLSEVRTGGVPAVLDFCNLLLTVAHHQVGLGFNIVDFRIQGSNFRIDTDVALSAADLAHLRLS